MKTNHSRVMNTTKQGQRTAKAAAEHAYNNRGWTYRNIWDAYEKPSYAKEKAWHYCRELCADMGGFDLLILSRNTFQFSAVFKFTDDETGELCYAYITRDYDRFCHA